MNFDNPNVPEKGNPKDLIGSLKIPFHLWPETATILGCLAMHEGACKYGRSNYRGTEVKASVYTDALRRHMNSWFEGEDIDPDSGISHLGKAIACIAILIDAQAAGTMIDDRMFKGGYDELIKSVTPLVKELKERYIDKHPKHYTIKDNSKHE